jgi:two-component system, OmpR family, sensor kinase
VASGTFTSAVGPPPPPLYMGFGGPGTPYQVVLAVPSGDITEAWLSALPGVGIAGGIALPFAILAAVLIARQVARPIHELTLASEAMALGDFDQRVEVARSDEVGRLAQAFSTMAERVGERDVQMRALVANVSHDLKTPMTSIMGYAQALEDGLIEPDRVGHIAGVIRDQAATTNLLLADLLFLSEVDAGQTLQAPQDIPASQLAAAAVERMQAVADQKGVSIALTADDSVCADVDAEKLTRALANVIDNAVRYSPEGGTVHVEASNAGDELQIEVTNTGPLIADEELPLIFDRFYRCDSSTAGHGLGLAIAQEAVELSGGRIEARNTPTGVAVAITVPRRQGSSA